MNRDPSKSSTAQACDGRKREQFPVDTKIFTKAQLQASGSNGDLLRFVITNDEQTNQCAPYREYAYGDTGVSIEDVASFTMRCNRMEAAQEAVDAFVGSIPLALDMPQLATWHCGVYSPSAARKRLYKATDPDDSTKMIGLLIEQNASGRFLQLTWYKTRETGTIFGASPGELEFQPVTDGSNAPSVDPNDIGGWTWYYTTSSVT